MPETASKTRRSRFWLYAPFVLLGLVAVAWSAAWVLLRNRASEALDRFLAAEARAGRQWSCADRRIGGYPFRIEVACASLTMRRGETALSLGRMRSVAQVYRPDHVIAEFDGPLRLTDGRIAVEGTWRLLETSIRGSARGFQRASLMAADPNIKITGAVPDALTLASRSFEAHLRPNPARPDEGAYDAAITAKQARLPILDELLGGSEPADLQIDVTATQAEGLAGRPLADEVERWRRANGRLDVLLLSLAKGGQRVEAKGAVRLDDLHRPAGELSVAAAGLDGLIASLTGNRIGSNLLGALFGQKPRPPLPGTPAAPAAQPALSPLPPLRLEDGRLLLGPFTVPGVRLPALY